MGALTLGERTRAPAAKGVEPGPEQRAGGLYRPIGGPSRGLDRGTGRKNKKFYCNINRLWRRERSWDPTLSSRHCKPRQPGTLQRPLLHRYGPRSGLFRAAKRIRAVANLALPRLPVPPRGEQEAVRRVSRQCAQSVFMSSSPNEGIACSVRADPVILGGAAPPLPYGPRVASPRAWQGAQRQAWPDRSGDCRRHAW